MILHGILTALAVLSFALMAWQWLAARRFPLHRRPSLLPATPSITLLKPLKGCDEHTERCLRSWLKQEYAGELQFLFAVAKADDPVCAIVKRLLDEFSTRDAHLVICPEQLGANAKVSKLAQIEPRVRHELVVISDADVWVPPDLLAQIIQPLLQTVPTPGTAADMPGAPVFNDYGLVNCFYKMANPTTLAMRWEAVAVNADFWSQVLQGATFRKLDFALGAVMATRRKYLAEIGGFPALADCLADDYQLGHRIAQRGHRVELCPVVVECWSSPMTWGQVWRHQLRWARTVRVCQPLPYFFSILANGTFWPLLWLAITPSAAAALAALAFILARIVSAHDLQRRLTQSNAHLPYLWLTPLKDLLQVALWGAAFLGNHIEWRGERYRLRKDGTLVSKDP